MSGSGKSLLGLWLYRSGEQEWAVKQGSPIHGTKKQHRSLVRTNLFGVNELVKRLKFVKILFSINAGYFGKFCQEKCTHSWKYRCG